MGTSVQVSAVTYLNLKYLNAQFQRGLSVGNIRTETMLIEAIKLLQAKGSSCIFLVTAVDRDSGKTWPVGGDKSPLTVLENSPVPVITLDASQGLNGKSKVYSMCNGIIFLVSPMTDDDTGSTMKDHLPADQNVVFVSSTPQWSANFTRIKRMPNTLLFASGGQWTNKTSSAGQEIHFEVYSKPNYFKADLEKVAIFDGKQYTTTASSSLDLMVINMSSLSSCRLGNYIHCTSSLCSSRYRLISWDKTSLQLLSGFPPIQFRTMQTRRTTLDLSTILLGLSRMP